MVFILTDILYFQMPLENIIQNNCKYIKYIYIIQQMVYGKHENNQKEQRAYK